MPDPRAGGQDSAFIPLPVQQVGICQTQIPLPPGPQNSRESPSGLGQPGMKPLTLIIEAVDAVDAGTLVVPTEQEEVLGVLDLIGQQQADSLQ